jgi:precorrin-6A/cobalt-precorrin-6A reductase
MAYWSDVPMTETPRLLILGGTGEAATLAETAHVQFSGRLDVIYSLAGRIKPVREFAATVRVGGFGGGAGLADYIKSENIKLLIDATHPFAKNISANAYDASLAADMPRLTLTRPPWDLPPGAKFLEADDMAHAARILPDFAKRVLVTTGQSSLDELKELPDIHFFIRVIEEPNEKPALENYTFITGRPPFTMDDELALMQDHAIDAVLTKQSGGTATVAKIIAAIRRHIPVVLIRRPLPEPGESVESVEDALMWLEQKL